MKGAQWWPGEGRSDLGAQWKVQGNFPIPWYQGNVRLTPGRSGHRSVRTQPGWGEGLGGHSLHSQIRTVRLLRGNREAGSRRVQHCLCRAQLTPLPTPQTGLSTSFSGKVWRLGPSNHSLRCPHHTIPDAQVTSHPLVTGLQGTKVAGWGVGVRNASGAGRNGGEGSFPPRTLEFPSCWSLTVSGVGLKGPHPGNHQTLC